MAWVAGYVLAFGAIAAFRTNLRTAAGMGTSLPFVAGGFVLACAALLAWVPAQRKRTGVAILLFLLASACLVICAGLLSGGYTTDSAAYRWTRFIGLLLLCAAVITVAAVLLFDVLLRAVRLRPPGIVADLVIAVAYVAAAISLLGSVGVNLTGILATSAVVTAVIGFSLQDTLGNVMGGMAVQIDRSIGIGDWIRVGDVEGRVTQIRWRHTAVETRNWDTVLIPNTVLTKSQVIVLGRRTGQPQQRRQWVYFNIDYRYSPTLVTDTVESALRGESLPNVAAEPVPQCIMMDFKDSYGSYAVRYWLTDIAPNDLTDSLVRSRIYGALRRAGIDPSIPAQHVFFTRDDAARRDRKAGEEMHQRAEALRGLEIFHMLTDEERNELAGRLRLAPFLRGETIMRQGTRGDWLYVLVRGSAEVRVTSDDGRASTRLATLNPGDFFGEMGLMTGGERTASVIALADCACYRLDKHEFVDVLVRRPQIADEIAQVLARRRAELDAAREGLNEQAQRERLRATHGDLLERIRRFFNVGA